MEFAELNDWQIFEVLTNEGWTEFRKLPIELAILGNCWNIETCEFDELDDDCECSVY